MGGGGSTRAVRILLECILIINFIILNNSSFCLERQRKVVPNGIPIKTKILQATSEWDRLSKLNFPIDTPGKKYVPLNLTSTKVAH